MLVGLYGRAVQVDPMNPKFKPPGTKRLKLNHDNPLSNFAFKSNLSRYNMGEAEPEFHRSLNTILGHPMESEQNRWAVGLLTFTRETSGEVRRCRLTLSNPR